jgi:hypothetical protein
MPTSPPRSSTPMSTAMICGRCTRVIIRAPERPTRWNIAFRLTSLFH